MSNWFWVFISIEYMLWVFNCVMFGFLFDYGGNFIRIFLFLVIVVVIKKKISSRNVMLVIEFVLILLFI